MPSAARRSATSSSSSRTIPTRKTILLEQNYRSTQTILSAANAVIARNAGRKPKNLWSDAGDGAPIVGYVADNEHDEASFVAGEVDRLTDDEGVLPSHVAVFYRTNAQSRVFEEVFIRVGLPYKVVGGVRFYERREVRDAVAYLRVLANPADTVSLRRILNVPKRGIGDRSEACIEALAQREALTFNEALHRARTPTAWPPRSLAAVQGFRTLLDDLRTLVEARTPPATILEAVLERTGYAAELSASADPQDETRLENLQELVAVAREFEEANPGGSLVDFMETVALVADADEIPDEELVDGQPAQGRRDLDDAAHRQGAGVSRSCSSPASRTASSRTCARWAIPPSSRRSGGSPTSASPGPEQRLYLSRADGAQRLGSTTGEPRVPVPRGDPRQARRLAAPRVLGPLDARHCCRRGAGVGVLAGQPRRHQSRPGRPRHPRRVRLGHGRVRGGCGGARDRVDRLP